MFLLAFFTAGAQATEVTVHGKGPDGEGQDATLSEIKDIVRFVTGKPTGEFTFNKDSLLLINGWKDGSNMKTHARIFQFNSDGTGHTEADLASTAEHTTWSGPFNYSKMPGDVLSTRGKDGTFYAIQHQLPVWLRIVTWRDGKLDGSYSSGSISSFGLHHNASDVKAGIKLPGFDGEVIAFCTKEGERAELNFMTMGKNEWGTNSLTPIPQAWSVKVAYNGTVAQMYDGKKYFPVSMAVGDYDGDGYKNEAVIVCSDTKGVYFWDFKLTYANGGFSLGLQSSGTPFMYDSETNHLDGIARTLSCSVVTDGEWHIAFPVGVKAAVGDFNGDGRDDIAVMKVMINYTEHYEADEGMSRHGIAPEWILWLTIKDMNYGAAVEPVHVRHGKHYASLFPSCRTHIHCDPGFPYV